MSFCNLGDFILVIVFHYFYMVSIEYIILCSINTVVALVIVIGVNGYLLIYDSGWGFKVVFTYPRTLLHR